MKDNYITLKDKEGNKKEYRVLMNIEETSNDVNYLVYTDDSINDNGELNVSSIFIKILYSFLFPSLSFKVI